MALNRSAVRGNPSMNQAINRPAQHSLVNSQSNSQSNSQQSIHQSFNPARKPEPDSSSTRRSFDAIQAELSNQTSALGDLTLSISSQKEKFVRQQKMLASLRYDIAEQEKANQTMDDSIKKMIQQASDRLNKQSVGQSESQESRQLQVVLERERKQAHRLKEAAAQLEDATSKLSVVHLIEHVSYWQSRCPSVVMYITTHMTMLFNCLFVC